MNYTADIPKKVIFKEIGQFIDDQQLNITDKDMERPWGGFFVIDEEQSEQFISRFFPGQDPEEFKGFSKLSPKILLVQPGKRLSWQYHHRRAEIWKVIGGNVGVIVSETDVQTDLKPLQTGDLIQLECGQRHRLVGLEKEWGIIAEIWKHTDPEHPSDEEDIVRVEDDFGR